MTWSDSTSRAAPPRHRCGGDG